jgi:PIN domain
MAKRESTPVGDAWTVGLLLDTCVWIDLATNYGNEPLLSALESLCRQHVIDLIVPQLVRDEFVRNRERIIKESGRSLASALKRARVAMWTYGDPRKRRNAVEVIDDIDHRLNGPIEVAAEAIKRIEVLFSKAIECTVNDKTILAASKRAMEKRAPFHNGRNNFADAVLIELYGQMVTNGSTRCVFVSHNVKDFSAPDKDQRQPHTDFAAYFSKGKSRYFIKLVDALRAVRPNEFAEAMYESEFTMEPRKASEISEAITELTDRVWYDRHMVARHKLEMGKTKIIAKKDFGPQHYRDSAHGRLVVDDVWAGALKAARRLEKKYGKENLGPYSKFDWGMINGKLSALRWVFGDEWDMLDT